MLGLDTATSVTTVAVHDGGQLRAEHSVTDARRHAEVLGPAIVAVLAQAEASAADLTRVVVGVGPGPYTGLRVGVATATALGAAIDVPVQGICSLDVLAHQAGRGTPITVLTDARRREVFWASYGADGERTTGPDVTRPADVAASLTGRAVGPGALLYADVFEGGSGPEALSAGALCTLAVDWVRTGRNFLPALPIYLRRPDTAPPAPAKRVLQA